MHDLVMQVLLCCKCIYSDLNICGILVLSFRLSTMVKKKKKVKAVQPRHYTFKVTLCRTFVSLVLVNYTLEQYENPWKAGKLAERKHMMVLA